MAIISVSDGEDASDVLHRVQRVENVDDPDTSRPGQSSMASQLLSSTRSNDPLTERRTSRRRRTHIAVHLISVIAISLVLRQTSGYWVPLAAAAFGVALVSQLSFTFHESVHGHASINRTLNRVWGVAAGAPVGLSLTAWSKKHIREHHRHPRNILLDPDVRVGKLVRLSEDQPRSSYHALQSLYELPLVSLAPFLSLSPADLSGESHAGARIRIVFEKYVCFFLFWWTTQFLGESWKHGVVRLLLVAPAIGFAALVVTQSQHNNDLVARRVSPREHWTAEQLQLHNTSDTATDSKVTSWIFGFTNHHAAHHLCPAIEGVLLPHATAKLQNLVAESRAPYFQHPSAWSAFKSHRSLVRRLAKSTE